MKKITITIDQEGNSEIDVQGYTGSQCTEVTKAIEQALGTVVEREKKPEFHLPPEQQHNKLKNG